MKYMHDLQGNKEELLNGYLIQIILSEIWESESEILYQSFTFAFLWIFHYSATRPPGSDLPSFCSPPSDLSFVICMCVGVSINS